MVAPHTVRARFVVPMAGEPILCGYVTLSGDAILAVGKTAATMPVVDLGDVALLPGLVNAHVHLDFSELTTPLGRRGMSFADWLRTVIHWKRMPGYNVSAAESRGLGECERFGASLIGEISQSSAADGLPETGQLHRLCFRELIGVRPERALAGIETARAHAREFVDRASEEPGRPAIRRRWSGLSPHAPYSVSPALLGAAVEFSRDLGVPLAMHLAESPEELQCMAQGDGPLRELLCELGVWADGVFPVGVRPLWYLQRLAQASRSLVIHGNFLDRAEMDFLAERPDRLAVVYCPRTHDYFAHPKHPLAEMLARGVRVVLGTDGRGSNPDLDILAEARFVASRYSPSIGPAELLAMITSVAADSLGLGDVFGRIAPGRAADLVVVPLDENGGDDPYEAVLASRHPARPLRVWPAGSSSAAPQ